MEPSTGTSAGLRSDADLIVEARGGDAAAFGALYERHAGAALVVARQYAASRSEADDVVSDAFAAVWSALRGGSGPTDAFRAYLFTVVRRVAAVQRDRGRRAEPTDDIAVLEAGSVAAPAAEEPALAGFERSVVARAFAGLPQRWQAVLWHSEVEGLTPAQIAPLLGLSANSTAALAYRAREGLRQAYLQQHLADPLEDPCRAVAGKLGGYVRSGLGARDTAQVEAHLDTCGECRALVLELRDVNRGMRAVIAPLVLGVVGMGALRFVLPTSGGVAAGSASLASGGAAVGGAGAGAGAAVGGGGLAAAVASALSSVPIALAAAVAGVVLVGGITYGVVQLTSGDDEADTPAPTATSGATPGLSGSPNPSGLPETDVPADEPTSEPSSEPTPPGQGSLTETAPTATEARPVPTLSPPPPPAEPGPALLVVGDLGALVLEAGVSGQGLAVQVSNEGESAATGLNASVDLPDGVIVTAVSTASTGRLGVHATAGDWSCRNGDGGLACTLPVLGAGETSRLAVTVDVAEDFAPETASVTWHVTGEGIAAVSRPTLVPVNRAPARLVLGGLVADRELVRRGVTALDLTVRNAGGIVAAPATVAVDAPPGIAVTGDDGWDCRSLPGGELSCTTPGIDPGTTVTLPLTVTAAWWASEGTLLVSFSPGGTTPVPFTVVAPTAPSLRYESAGSLGVTEVGAPLLACDVPAGERACWDLERNNNDYAMVPFDSAGPTGQEATVSSSARLELPKGAEVEFAGLYWSANRGPGDSWLGDPASARLRGPGGGYVPVTATSTWMVVDNASRRYYQSFADVTAQVAAAPDATGSWSVADVAVSAERTDANRTYYAGWSLVVVYSQPEAERSVVSVYDGANWVAADSSVDLPIAAGSGAQVRVGVVAWDGDRGTSGDTLRLDRQALTPQGLSGPGSSGNAFDSTATGFGHRNSLGTDAKGFVPVRASNDDAILTAGTKGDQYLLGAVTVRVSD